MLGLHSAGAHPTAVHVSLLRPLRRPPLPSTGSNERIFSVRSLKGGQDKDLRYFVMADEEAGASGQPKYATFGAQGGKSRPPRSARCQVPQLPGALLLLLPHLFRHPPCPSTKRCCCQLPKLPRAPVMPASRKRRAAWGAPLLALALLQRLAPRSPPRLLQYARTVLSCRCPCSAPADPVGACGACRLCTLAPARDLFAYSHNWSSRACHRARAFLFALQRQIH